MTTQHEGQATSKQVVKQSTLALGSVLAAAVVVAALVITMVFVGQKPSADEAALRAVLAGAPAAPGAPVAPSTQVDATPAAPTTAPINPPEAAPPTAPTAPATPTATAVPPTSVPQVIPTATPLPTPAPVPTSVSSDAIVRLSPGRVTVPVGPALTFELAQSHDSIHLPGISALYFDGLENAETDIFVPVATSTGQPLFSFDDVVRYLDTSPLFTALTESPRGGIAFEGRAIGYEGRTSLAETTIGFYTHPTYVGNGVNGWYVPEELQLWVLDLVTGPVIVTGEAVTSDPLALGRAVDLMGRVIATLEVG